jgi:vacuolar-type H+-ATPase subunit F/Vma7
MTGPKKMVVIGDEDTIRLFNLLGIDGVLLTEAGAAQFDSILNPLLADQTVGIIAIPEKLFLRHRSRLVPLKKNTITPLLVEIPDLHGTLSANELIDFVQNQIGVGGA